jgi:hypothetical protein
LIKEVTRVTVNVEFYHSPLASLLHPNKPAKMPHPFELYLSSGLQQFKCQIFPSVEKDPGPVPASATSPPTLNKSSKYQPRTLHFEWIDDLLFVKLVLLEISDRFTEQTSSDEKQEPSGNDQENRKSSARRSLVDDKTDEQSNKQTDDGGYGDWGSSLAERYLPRRR